MRVLALVLLTVAALAVPAPVLAGDVVAVGKGGKLTVKGSPNLDSLTLTLAGQDVQITPGAGTTVNGDVVPVVFSVTGNVTMDLGAGNDVVSLDAVPLQGNVKVKLGDGFDTFNVQGSTVGGGLTVDLGAGAASLALCDTDVVKGVTIKGGPAGPGSAGAGCLGVDNAEVFVTNGVAVAVGKFHTAGNLAVKLKTGNGEVIVASSVVGGKGSFTFGDGTTLLGLCDAGVEGSLKVSMKGGGTTGMLSCQVPGEGGSIGGAHGVLLVRAAIGESATVKGGKGFDAFVSTKSTLIGESLKLALGNGEGTFYASGTIGESFVAKGEGLRPPRGGGPDGGRRRHHLAR